jgi:hypothetical protein
LFILSSSVVEVVSDISSIAVGEAVECKAGTLEEKNLFLLNFELIIVVDVDDLVLKGDDC